MMSLPSGPLFTTPLEYVFREVVVPIEPGKMYLVLL